jgi:cytochrome c biogenesis protein CcmG, thiol:disulfide interchange protein DsbE
MIPDSEQTNIDGRPAGSAGLSAYDAAMQDGGRDFLADDWSGRAVRAPHGSAPVPADLRSRLRESRAGTLLVLAVTTLLMLGAAYLVNRHGQDSGVRAVTLTGERSGAPPKIGSPAQDFTATTLDGKTVSLSDYRGRPVWLTFGASWCAACQAEAPDVEAAYRRFADSGVVVLAVSISESASAARDYADLTGLTYPMVADPDTRIASAYRVLGIPSHFFIGRDGELHSMRVGSLSPAKMSHALKAISG